MAFLRKRVSKKNIEDMQNYKYESSDTSIIYNRLLKPFAQFLSKGLPKCISPNAITVFGFTCVLVGYIQSLLICPRFSCDFPKYLSFLGALAYFIYQTCDNMDGVHARNTGMCSPLGDLLDHALDTFVFCAGGTGLAMFLQLGLGWKSFTLPMLLTFCSLLVEWDAYHTRVMNLGSFNGPTEGILISLVFVVLSGLYGTCIWRAHAFTLAGRPVSTGTVVFGVVSLCMLPIIANAFRHVRHALGAQPGAYRRALAHLLPGAATWLLGYAWIALCPEVLVSAPRAFYVLFSMLLCHHTNELIVNRLLVDAHRPSHMLLLLPAFPLLPRVLGLYAAPPAALVVALAACAAAFTALWIADVALQAARGLDIPLLRAFPPRT